MRTGLIVAAVVVVLAILWFAFSGGEPEGGDVPATDVPEGTATQ